MSSHPSPGRRLGALGATGAAVALVCTLALPMGVAATAAPLTSSLAASASERVFVDQLRVEGRADSPLGLGDPAPTLGWVLHGFAAQTGYQIRAASTERGLKEPDLWDSGRVNSSNSTQVKWGGNPLKSRQIVYWQVRVYGPGGDASPWSAPATFELGLLDTSDWGNARWIEYPGRSQDQALPIFARAFDVRSDKAVSTARLYVSGLGVAVQTINGQAVTDEVLAPGNTIEMRSAEYRAYDVTSLVGAGSNTIGVELGNGTAYSQRVQNASTGRTVPFVRWLTTTPASSQSTEAISAGATSVAVRSASGFAVGQTLNIDTGDGGDRLESRLITAVSGTTITFDTPVTADHAAGVSLGTSGPVTQAHAGVTPRVIARLEVTYADGSSDSIVTDRSWQTALGATTNDNWFSGSDYDARREQVGWNSASADLSATATRRNGEATGWVPAGIAPAPSLSTDLIERSAETVKIVDSFTPVSVTQATPGVWVFDMGQAFAGFAQLKLPGSIPAGTTVKMWPGEMLKADGTIDRTSMLQPGSSEANPMFGLQYFDTYTSYGNPNGETWRPQFNYDGFQYIQVTGLPEGFTPTADLITGLQTAATPPEAGTLETSSDRVNRIHQMSHYSIMSNMQSIFTDCPNREKSGWLADMIQSMPAIDKHYDMAAFLRSTQRNTIEGQFTTGTNAGFTPGIAPNDENTGTGFGNDLNWNGAIVLTPYVLYKNYGDQETVATSWQAMELFMDYIRTRRTTAANQYIVDNGLGDWAAGDQTTPRALTATSGYYLLAARMAEMAGVLGNTERQAYYSGLAENINTAFNDRFFNPTLGYYTNTGATGTATTQANQALPLDYGMVPAGKEQGVLDKLVEQIYSYNPFGGKAHTSGGTVGLGPIVRALQDGGRDDVLWDMLQEDTRPSYGFFMQPTVAHPNGATTIPEYWDLHDSQNHMILLQTDEWFTTGLAGIQQAENSIAYKRLVIKPRVVGDLNHVKGTYNSPYGTIASEWTKGADGALRLDVTVPSGSTAEIWVPTTGKTKPKATNGAKVVHTVDGYTVYEVRQGSYTFRA